MVTHTSNPLRFFSVFAECRINMDACIAADQRDEICKYRHKISNIRMKISASQIDCLRNLRKQKNTALPKQAWNAVFFHFLFSCSIYQAQYFLLELLLLHVCKFLRLICCDTCVDDFLDISVHNFIQLIQC